MKSGLICVRSSMFFFCFFFFIVLHRVCAGAPDGDCLKKMAAVWRFSMHFDGDVLTAILLSNSLLFWSLMYTNQFIFFFFE